MIARCSATPVTIPGSAIGNTSASDSTSRPKKRNRCTANAANDPSTAAIPVAPSPARTELRNAARTSSLRQAVPHHFVDHSVIGHTWIFDSLNANSAMTTSGR